MKNMNFLVPFILLHTHFLLAQSPGGVKDYKLWIKASTFNDASTFDYNDTNTNKLNQNYFNFNPILKLDSREKRIFKNILQEKHSLFFVFKSDVESEKSVVNITKGKSKILITNKALLGDDEIKYSKVDSKTGIILCYLSSGIDKGKRNNKISIDDYFGENNDGHEQLLEIIYYPRILNKVEKLKVETYLSLKYGLSIVGESDYIGSDGKKIWEYKKNKLYNCRVTGIGRDDQSELLQKQSGNAKNDGIYIGLGIIDTTNQHNKYPIDDKTFLMWGDNNGSTVLSNDKKNKNIKTMGRNWKMHLTSDFFMDTISTELRVSKSEMDLFTETKESDESLWLVINDSTGTKFSYTGARFFKQSREDSAYIYFDKIKWDIEKNGSDLFTFIQAPDMFVTHEESEICDKEGMGILKLQITGGTPPFTVDLVSKTNKKNIYTSEYYHEFSNLNPEEYSITLQDNKGILLNEKTILDPFAQFQMTMPNVWVLDKDEILIKPSYNDNAGKLSFEWKKAEAVISDRSEIAVKELGDYILIASNEKGCQQQFSFRVIPDSFISGWQIYPNPTKKGHDFSIKFNLKQQSLVNVSINSIEGKLVLNKDLGKIQEFHFKNAITTSGVYLVTVTIDDNPETVKLIID